VIINMDIYFKYHWDQRDNPVHREFIRRLIRLRKIQRERNGT
jgi:hypothetical protein